MYFNDNFADYGGGSRFAGFSEPRDTGPVGTSVAAIEAALKLDPAGGYVKGTVPRQLLEAAFNAVPLTSASALIDELKQGTGPLARLFRYRLHPATQQAMQGILEKKSSDQKQEEEKAKLNVKLACDALRKLIEDSSQMVKLLESAVEKICKLNGESSDACLKARFDLEGNKMKLGDRVRQLRSMCP